jgi:VanZ family protein
LRSGTLFRRRVVLWGPVIAYMAVLFYIQSQSTLPSPPGGISDKDEHFFFYGILAALALRALANGERRGIRLATVLGAILISSAYGVSDEFHQRFVPGRTYEVLDMAADALGSAAAGCLLWAWSIIGRRPDSRHVL